MPLIADDETPLGVSAPTPPVAATENPSILETAKSAFIENNWVFRSYQNAIDRGDAVTDLSHNPFDIIKGTKFEADPERFAYSHNAQETQAIMDEADQDEHARDVLSRSGWFGTVAGVASGLLDPTIFLPVAKVFSGAAQGYRSLRLAADTAIAGAVSGTASEYMLYQTTPDMTFGDAAKAVGIQTALGGLIGGAVGMFTRAERGVVEGKLQADREEWGAELGAQSTQPAGAAATDTRTLELNLPKVMQKYDPSQKLAPPRRVLTSPFVSARRATADLVETPYIFKENEAGVATTQGPALDRLIRMRVEQGRMIVADTVDRLYTQYRFGGDAGLLKKKSTAITDQFDKTRTKATAGEFKEMIDDALRNNDEHAVPEVAEAARTFREHVIAPARDEAIRLGLLPEGVEAKTADSYMMRVYNKQKIVGQRPEFIRRVADWLDGQQEIKAGLQETISRDSDSLGKTRETMKGLETKIAASKKEAVTADLQRRLDTLTAQHDQLRTKLEASLLKWEGKSSKEAKSAIKARDDAEAQRSAMIAIGAYKGAHPGRLAAADDAIDKAVNRIVNSDRNRNRQEIEDLANQITNRILGGPDGRLPYDAPSGGPKSGISAHEAPRGPLASREFMIPDNMIKDFLDRDIANTLDLYTKTMWSDIGLTERFGDVNMTDVFKKLNEEADALSAAAKTEKERIKINNQREKVLADLAGMRDRVRGTLGFSANPALRNAGRIVHALSTFDVPTNLGAAALSSAADMAGAQWQYGFRAVFKRAWAPMLKALGDPEMRKAVGAQRRALVHMGIGAETWLKMHTSSLGDVLDVYRPTSRFERALSFTSDKFSVISGLSPWTDGNKFIGGMVSMGEMTDAAFAHAEGKATAKQVRRLAEAGVDGAMAQRIRAAMEATGGSEIIRDVRIPTVEAWKDRGAADAFEAAVARDVDMMVLTPGAERPLRMTSSPAWKLVLQYKSFVAAAHERLLVRSLMQRDVNVLHGIASSIALGMLAEYATGVAAGRDPPRSTADWVKAGVNRAGVLGWYTEANSLAAKEFGGNADVFSLIGSSKPDARYISRSKLAALLGPTAGKLEALLKVGQKAATGTWSASDTRSMRRLLVGQNLFYIRRLLDQVEGGINDAFGIVPLGN